MSNVNKHARDDLQQSNRKVPLTVVFRLDKTRSEKLHTILKANNQFTVSEVFNMLIDLEFDRIQESTYPEEPNEI